MSCWLHVCMQVFQASIAIFTVCANKKHGSRTIIDDLFLRQMFTFDRPYHKSWLSVMIHGWIIVRKDHKATTTAAVCATYFARAGFRLVYRMCCQLVSLTGSYRIGYYLSQHESSYDWYSAQPLHFWLFVDNLWLSHLALLSHFTFCLLCPLSTVFSLENNRGNSTRATLTVGKTPAELNAVLDGSPLLVERYTEFLDSKIHTRVPICRRRYCWSVMWWLFVGVSFLVNI